MDRGLNQWKTGGSLENKPGRTGISGYGPLDRDLAAQDGSGLDLIWRVDSGSGGHGRLGCGRRRVLAGTEFRGGDLTEEGQKGTPVHGLAWDLAQMLENGMRDALEHSERRCGTGRGVLTGEGGSAATDLVGVRVRTESRLESGCELVRARARCQGMSILGSRGVLPC